MRGDADVIAGAELGGVALAAAASMVSGKRFIIVRNSKKDYGTSKQVEGLKDQAGLPDAETLAGKRVLLVEDIATTGGQVLEAAKVLTEMGATVTRIVATIDRQEGAGEHRKSRVQVRGPADPGGPGNLIRRFRRFSQKQQRQQLEPQSHREHRDRISNGEETTRRVQRREWRLIRHPHYPLVSCLFFLFLRCLKIFPL